MACFSIRILYLRSRGPLEWTASERPPCVGGCHNLTLLLLFNHQSRHSNTSLHLPAQWIKNLRPPTQAMHISMECEASRRHPSHMLPPRYVIIIQCGYSLHWVGAGPLRLDLCTGILRFYNSITEILEDPNEKDEVEHLMTWWNRNAFIPLVEYFVLMVLNLARGGGVVSRGQELFAAICKVSISHWYDCTSRISPYMHLFRLGSGWSLHWLCLSIWEWLWHLFIKFAINAVMEEQVTTCQGRWADSIRLIGHLSAQGSIFMIRGLHGLHALVFLLTRWHSLW